MSVCECDEACRAHDDVHGRVGRRHGDDDTSSGDVWQVPAHARAFVLRLGGNVSLDGATSGDEADSVLGQIAQIEDMIANRIFYYHSIKFFHRTGHTGCKH